MELDKQNEEENVEVNENDISLSKEKLFEKYNTSGNGLSTYSVRERLDKFGKNVLREKKPKPKILKFLSQFNDVLIIVLLFACVFSIVVGCIENDVSKFFECGIIFIVVLINAVIGYVQELKSEKSMQALKEMTKPYAKVIRQGITKKIKTEDLVIGDIVILEAGDIVPADMRIIESASLKVEESALTGESVPVEKNENLIKCEQSTIVPLGDQSNMLFMGSTVTYGRARAIVVATGMKTQMGLIAKTLDEVKEDDTPLTKKIKKTNIYITILVVAVSLALLVVNIIQGGWSNFVSAFTMAIAIAVCAIPEGLPACMTLTMALGIGRMSKKRAIVKKLASVETLGSTEIICSDKTGTLTLNKMTVKEIFTFDENYKKLDKYIKNEQTDVILAKKDEISEENFEISKNITEAIDIVEGNKNLTMLLNCMLLCNDTKVQFEGESFSLVTIGDPTETALVHYGYKLGINKEKLDGNMPRVAELPFDSDRKLMSTFHECDGKYYMYTKGAIDNLLLRCTKILVDGKVKKLTKSDIISINDKNIELGNRALRVLAYAYKEIDKIPKTPKNDLESDLVFIGLSGMIDPPREEVYSAIKTCKQAGITTIMITGDHKNTAFAIAKDLKIATSEKEVITGAELSAMNDAEFMQAVDVYRVYARVNPEHKVKIVKALQSKGKIVAMTGDGVNDAPSIKQADIGVGMGITGTDVTKNVADIVLTDDNFATIVGAVEEGRKIYANILKIVQFLFGTSLAELILLTVMNFVTGNEFFNAPLLLWLNFVSDTFVALALGLEGAEDDIMKQKPNKNRGSLFSGRVGFNIIFATFFILVIVLGIYFFGIYVLELSHVSAVTMSYLTLAFVELFHAINLKSDHRSIFNPKLHKNKWFTIGFLGSVIFASIIVAIPVLSIQNAFGICSLSWQNWLICLAFAILIIPIMEIEKFFIRLYDKKNKKS